MPIVRYIQGSYTWFTIPKNEIDKIDFALCNQPKETVEHYYNRQTNKPNLICNGGFFNMSDGTTIFNFRDNGLSISVSSSHKEGMGIKNNNILEFGNSDNSEYKDFISGYPVLIKNGEPVNTTIGSEIDYKARRSVLAYDNDKIYLIFVNDPGVRFADLKNFLCSLKVTYAINLDGGGSTRCLCDGKLIIGASYSRPIDNVICIYLKPTEKVIYRVQVGAYRNKANAEVMKNAIRRLSDPIIAGYCNAYIREIDGLYKVQVGAYSKKENAQRVVEDLKRRGYAAFIAK